MYHFKMTNDMIGTCPLQQKTVDWLVFLLIVGLPFSGVSIFKRFIPVPITDLLLVFTGVTIVASIVLDNQIILTKGEIGVLAAYTITVLLFTLSTVFNGLPIRPVATQFGRLLVLGIIVLYITTLDRARWVLTASFVAAVIISILTVSSSVFHLQIGLPFTRPRKLGPFWMPFSRTLGVELAYGIYGMYTLTATPYFLVLAIERRNYLLSAGIGIVVIGIVIGQSRSTWIAMLVAFSVVSVYMFVKWISAGGQFRRRIAGFLVAFGGMMSVPLAIFFFRLLITMEKTTVLLRLKQYHAALVAISANPLVGMGTEAFRARYELSYIPHNAFLRFGVDTGIIGFLLVTAIFVYTTLTVGRYAIQLRGLHQRYAVGVLAGLLAVIIEASFQPSLGRVAWVAVGLGVSSTVVCHHRLRNQ